MRAVSNIHEGCICPWTAGSPPLLYTVIDKSSAFLGKQQSFLVSNDWRFTIMLRATPTEYFTVKLGTFLVEIVALLFQTETTTGFFGAFGEFITKKRWAISLPLSNS